MKAQRLQTPARDPADGGTDTALRIAEALLFASPEPVTEQELVARLPAGTDVRSVLAVLQSAYADRGVNLLRVGDAWAFRTAADLAPLIALDAARPRKLSRAALEVLAIIAYHQPVTRAEIEEIRGVETSKGTLDLLLEADWVRLRGRRRTPGRPVTFGTTNRFLDQFGLEQIDDLPGADDLRGTGLLSSRPTAVPSARSPSAVEDEDPLTDIDLEDLGLLAPRDAQ